MLTLVPISLLLGVAMLWVFKHASNQAAIQSARRRVQACLYEMRLFTDEPALVWKAQVGLLAANVRYLAWMLVPAAVATIPMLVLFAHLEAWYGMRPLTLGQDTLVTMQMKTAVDLSAPPPELAAPPEISVESPPVRAVADRQVSWRIRPKAPISGVLRIVMPGATLEKKVEAGSGMRYISDKRVRGLLDFVWHPAESRLPAGNVDWIRIEYPPATLRCFGIGLHWLIWLVLFSMLSALLLKNRFGVTF